MALVINKNFQGKIEIMVGDKKCTIILAKPDAKNADIKVVIEADESFKIKNISEKGRL